ncbi:zinc carboxypeptidase superfamily protein, partial [Cystoisospora suis]
MRSLCGAAAFVGVASGCLASSGELPPFYHTTSQIREQLQELADSCEGFSVEHESIGNGHTVDIVQLSRVENAPHRFFMLAGEHARELISAESALHFLQVLCGKEGKLRDKANKVLQHTQFRVVVNGNPVSREKVENGDFCLRVNENHVDLNRNWSGKWSAGLWS